MNCRQIGKTIGILLLVLTLAGCRARPELKPDIIVDIPLNPTEAVTQPPTQPATEAPTAAPETQPVPEETQLPTDPRPEEERPTAPRPTEPRLTAAPALAREVAAAVNARRREAGLAELSVDAGLCRGAELRAAELPVLLSHTRPDGTGWETALGSPGGFAAELLHYGSGGPSAIVGRWLDYAPNREKLLSKAAVSMGAAACTIGNDAYVVVILTG